MHNQKLGNEFTLVELFPLIDSLSLDLIVSGITADSRTCEEGFIFFSLPSNRINDISSTNVRLTYDLHLTDAFSRGAKVAIVSSAYKDIIRVDDYSGIIIFVDSVVDEFVRVLSIVFPSKISAIGVTGTNGKTSIAWLLASILSSVDGSVGYIGTLGVAVFQDGKLFNSVPTQNTTPGILEIAQIFFELEKQGVSRVIIEVSSHGIAQRRINGINWAGAVFSNLSRDHLDYHASMKEYGDCKKELFTKYLVESSSKDKFAVINSEDLLGQKIIEELPAGILLRTFSREKVGSSYISVLSEEFTPVQTRLKVRIGDETIQLKTSLVGSFNVSNLLAVLGCMDSLGVKIKEILPLLEVIPQVPGRIERVGGDEFSVIVDYAHTPDALNSIQMALKELKPQRLITVFGCGGDRDRGKRPLMGHSVAQFSDFAVITSDNPRNESPEKIINDILSGIHSGSSNVALEYTVMQDRRDAIEYAINMAKEGDIVLVAGKGHEDYQEVKGERTLFSDRDVCNEIIMQMRKN